ncbi:MAG: gamma carbonic anhydrase family protein [Clostridiales bacterium]|nr:gamma carbonic anhydrase family protein [Clostridiales bacterium]
MIRKFKDFQPIVDEEAFIAETAVVIGQVEIKKDANIWFNAVIRGDVNKVTIGERTNIQDLTMIHVADDFETNIGDDVTIGHKAMIHGCTISNGCLIGMGAIVLDGAFIEENVIIGAGSLVTQGKRIPRNSLVLGSPGKVVRQITDDELKYFKVSAEEYVKLSKEY